MALDENVGDDSLRFVLTDKTPSSDLQLICQAPDDEVRQNWITQIHSILDMQGDLLRGKFNEVCVSRSFEVSFCKYNIIIVEYSSSWESVSELRAVTCHMGSHSVTCHPTQVNAPRRNPSQTGQYSIYLPRRDGRLN